MRLLMHLKIERLNMEYAELVEVFEEEVEAFAPNCRNEADSE